MEYKGSCLCGNNKFKIIGELETLYLCHCILCKKDSGSSNGSNLFSNKSEINWYKGGTDIKVYTLPNSRHTKCFCNNCGSALPYKINGLLVLPSGSLDEKIDFEVNAHIFYKDRDLWYDTLKKIKKYNIFPR